MTLYLKYRPQKISDLDLTDVKGMLGKLLAAQNLPHAFLFTGPRGTGKTSSARIVAKAINCLQAKGGEPCNECQSCISMTSGASPDLIEIDAASNRGIDEIRTLRDNINLSPMGSKYKVYIIDEVHMLTTEAANALLKTLEEPPPHAVFVLCTTDPQKLPETVISRCTRVNFKMPTITEAVERLNKIAKAEKIETDDEALKLIAKAGRGSFRDEIKIFEQIWLTNKKISIDATQEMLGMLQTADPGEFVQLLKDTNIQGSLDYVNNLVQHGVNVRIFIERVIEQAREELLTTKDSSLIDLIEGLDRAYDQARTSAVVQLPLEIMIMQMGGGTNKVIKATPKPETAKLPEPETKPVTKVDQPEVELVEVVISKPEIVEEISSEPKGKYKLDDVVAKWSDILKEVRPRNHSVEALLRSTSPVGFNGQDLMLEVFYKFHKDKLETDKCRQIVEEAVSTIFSIKPVHLKLKLGSKQKNEEVSAENIGEDLVKAATEIFKIDAV